MSSPAYGHPVDPVAELGEPLTDLAAGAVPTPPARLPRGYVALWVAAATLSGAYLTASALTGPERSGVDGAPQDTVLSSDTARAVEIAEARAMKYKVSLEDFQRDVSLLKAEFSGRSGDNAVVARLAALEERLSIETGVAVAKLPATGPSGTQAQFASVSEPSDSAVATNAAMAPMATTTATSPAGGPGKSTATRVAGAVGSIGSDGQARVSIPLETGSVLKPPARAELNRAIVPDGVQSPAFSPSTFGLGSASLEAKTDGVAPRSGFASPTPAIVLNAQPAAPTGAAGPTAQPPQSTSSAAAIPPAPAPPPKPFAVQLASGGSVESLRLSWSVLSEQHGDTLRPLEPRVSKSPAAPGATPIYDLVAGPFKTAADARKACKALATRGVDCKIGNFGGQSL